jgi:hypothetical protein
MNHGIAILVLRLICTPSKQVVWWVIVSLGIHIGVLTYLYQREKRGVHATATTSIKLSKEKGMG